MTYGVDFASVDGNKIRDLAHAAQAGCTFAFVRGSYERWTDPLAANDELQRIRDAGMVAGAYALPLYGPGHPSMAEQMRAFARGVDLRPGVDFPPVLDVELGGGGVAGTGEDRAAILAQIREAVRELRKLYGVAPMIYTSARVWDGSDADALCLGSVAALDLVDCPLWLARYVLAERQAARPDLSGRVPTAPTPRAWGEGNHWIRQYQGDAVGSAGFDKTVDLDEFRPCYEGETGRRVEWLQKKLGQVEGQPRVFDAVLADAVRNAQAVDGLVADGIVGPRSFALLAWR